MKVGNLTFDNKIALVAVVCAVIGVWQTGKWLNSMIPDEPPNDHFHDELGISWPRLI